MATFSKRYENILKSMSFIGLTGNVSFDKNGNRKHGLFSYCNFAKNTNVISKIGYFELPLQLFVLNDENIVWPKAFYLKNIIPPKSTYIASNDSSNGLQIVFYVLGGVVCLIILIYIIYFVIEFCKEFQDNFNNPSHFNSTDENQTLLNKEKRRLFVSISSDCISTMIGLTDYVTDILSLITIISAKKSLYSNTFLLFYFTVSVMSSFVFCAHFTITLKNMILSYLQLQSGLIDGIHLLFSDHKVNINADKKLNNHIRRRRLSNGRRLSALSSTHRQMIFRMNILKKIIKQQLAVIFVALCEDLPFFVLNLYSLLRFHEIITLILLLSFGFNSLSFGYKVCVVKEFFNNLQELGDIKENIANIVSHEQSRRVQLRQLPSRMTF